MMKENNRVIAVVDFGKDSISSRDFFTDDGCWPKGLLLVG